MEPQVNYYWHMATYWSTIVFAILLALFFLLPLLMIFLKLWHSLERIGRSGHSEHFSGGRRSIGPRD